MHTEGLYRNYPYLHNLLLIKKNQFTFIVIYFIHKSKLIEREAESVLPDILSRVTFELKVSYLKFFQISMKI